MAGESGDEVFECVAVLRLCGLGLGGSAGDLLCIGLLRCGWRGSGRGPLRRCRGRLRWGAHYEIGRFAHERCEFLDELLVGQLAGEQRVQNVSRKWRRHVSTRRSNQESLWLTGRACEQTQLRTRCRRWDVRRDCRSRLRVNLWNRKGYGRGRTQLSEDLGQPGLRCSLCIVGGIGDIGRKLVDSAPRFLHLI